MRTATQYRVSRLHFLSRTKSIVLALIALLICFCASTSSTEKNALPTDDEEQVVSLVLKSEIKANGWTKKDLVCFSVEGRYPSWTFVKTLRREGLNVCSAAEWPKKFNCGFEVRFQYAPSDSPQIVRLRTLAIDLRGINEGVGDIATTLRDGEYSLRKSAQKWSIADYIPEKQVGNRL
jgi:hypothetical protein